MFDELLEKKLKELKGDDILIVMDDGLAFLGELGEYDKHTLVLKNVYQSPSNEIDWKGISSESGGGREKIEQKEKFGFIDWTKVNLEEAYIQTAHVTRIWRWKKKEKGKQTPRSDESRKPVYTKRDKVPEERASSIGDIPGTHPG
ncbi:MAG: hypothetical protein ACLFSM_01305 [Thermoplasmata archaeon]